jgi:hypothetical protein
LVLVLPSGWETEKSSPLVSGLEANITQKKATPARPGQLIT